MEPKHARNNDNNKTIKMIRAKRANKNKDDLNGNGVYYHEEEDKTTIIVAHVTHSPLDAIIILAYNIF